MSNIACSLQKKIQMVRDLQYTANCADRLEVGKVVISFILPQSKYVNVIFSSSFGAVENWDAAYLTAICVLINQYEGHAERNTILINSIRAQFMQALSSNRDETDVHSEAEQTKLPRLDLKPISIPNLALPRTRLSLTIPELDHDSC